MGGDTPTTESKEARERVVNSSRIREDYARDQFRSPRYDGPDRGSTSRGTSPGVPTGNCQVGTAQKRRQESGDELDWVLQVGVHNKEVFSLRGSDAARLGPCEGLAAFVKDWSDSVVAMSECRKVLPRPVRAPVVHYDYLVLGEIQPIESLNE